LARVARSTRTRVALLLHRRDVVKLRRVADVVPRPDVCGRIAIVQGSSIEK